MYFVYPKQSFRVAGTPIPGCRNTDSRMQEHGFLDTETPISGYYLNALVMQEHCSCDAGILL